MRIVHFDIDSLRADHLGCYGYHRDTSPNIDRLAAEGIRFDNVYISDGPCLPSRTALWSGRTGFCTGVVNHGGTAAQPFIEGPTRGFQDEFGMTSWMQALRRVGMRTATVSSFAPRHSAWHWYAGYRDIMNPGKAGNETADDVNPLALDWLARHGREDNWFLHINYWDPHTPYRTPERFGDPFAQEPIPSWMTEEVWRRLREGYGPHSAREPNGSGFADYAPPYPRNPPSLDSMEQVKRWFDGYDTGVRYADHHLGQIVNSLADLGVLDETAIVVSADHGECLGELNVWGDHQTADHVTYRVPLIVRWPGVPAGGVDRALHYQFDWAATSVDLLGGEVPENWDAVTFAPGLMSGHPEGRPCLVLSMGAWSCMRSVRWDDFLCMFTYHDGYKDLPPIALFDVVRDPHEQHDIAREHPQLVARAAVMLEEWRAEMMARSRHNVDPLMTVMREGGPWQVRGQLPTYLDRLQATGRSWAADRLKKAHSEDLAFTAQVQ